jgi:hypothetical protein
MTVLADAPLTPAGQGDPGATEPARVLDIEMDQERDTLPDDADPFKRATAGVYPVITYMEIGSLPASRRGSSRMNHGSAEGWKAQARSTSRELSLLQQNLQKVFGIGKETISHE